MTTTILFSSPILKSTSALGYQSSTLSQTNSYIPPVCPFASSYGPSPSSSCSFQNAAGTCTFLTQKSRWCLPRTRKERASVRAGQNTSNVTSADKEERVRVKQELFNLLEATDGSLNQECLDLISILEKLNPNPEPSKVPELVYGCFQTVKSTLKGKDAKDAGVFASTFTLGRAAFGAFKPIKQEVILRETYNHIGQSKEDQYLIASEISIKNNDGESPERLEGYLINEFRCGFAADGKAMDVVFLSTVLRPVNPDNENELQSWKRLFREHNPSMDERGFMSITLPESKGTLDHLYLDDEIRIVRGNMGNIFVVKRLPSPAIPI